MAAAQVNLKALDAQLCLPTTVILFIPDVRYSCVDSEGVTGSSFFIKMKQKKAKIMHVFYLLSVKIDLLYIFVYFFLI